MKIITLVAIIVFIGCSEGAIPTHTIREKTSQSVEPDNLETLADLKKRMEALKIEIRSDGLTDDEQSRFNKLGKRIKDMENEVIHARELL